MNEHINYVQEEIRLNLRAYVTFGKQVFFFYDEDLLALRPAPGWSTTPCRRLFCTVCSICSQLSPIRDLRTRHTVVTRDTPNISLDVKLTEHKDNMSEWTVNSKDN
jgi:hypothetical protein